MKWAKHPRTGFLLAFVGILAVVTLLVMRLGKVSRNDSSDLKSVSSNPPAIPGSPAGGRAESPAAPGTGTPPAPDASDTPNYVSSPAVLVPATNLIIPVSGVGADQLRDTFADSRSEGRIHDAIDIPAPRGTPVLAAADGSIIKLFQSDRGGTTIYQLSADGKYFYYYAHLDRYAEGLAEGQLVKQGATIAYVGDTGNAGPGNYHLHFSIALVLDPKRYWEGVNINPYPLLKK